MREAASLNLPGIVLWTRWRESGHLRCAPSLLRTFAWMLGGSSTSRPLLHKQSREVVLINTNGLWSNKEPTWTQITAHLLNVLVDRRRTTACLSGSVMSSNRSGTGENGEIYQPFDHLLCVNHDCRYSPCHWRSGEGGWHDHREGSGAHRLDRPDRKDTTVRMIRFSYRITGHSIRVNMLDEKKLS